MTVKDRLEAGKVYTFFRQKTKGEDMNTPKVRKERWRLVAKYTHHAQFENQMGIRQSFQYWDIEKMLRGGI